VAWGSGLYNTANPAKAVGCPFRIRLRRKGTSTWINLPEFHIQNKRVVPLQKTVKLMWQATPALPTPPDGEGFVYAYGSIGNQTVAPGGGAYTVNSYFIQAGTDFMSSTTMATTNVRNVALYDDRVEFYLSGATFPKDKWEIEVLQGAPYLAADFTGGSYTAEPSGVAAQLDFFGYNTVRQNDGVNDGLPRTWFDLPRLTYGATIAQISNVWNEHPTPLNDCFTIAVKVHGRRFEALSTRAASLIADWNGSAWTGHWASDNPAAILRAILVNGSTQDLNLDPLPTTMLDNATLVAWRAQCISKGYKCNMVIQGRTVQEALELAAGAGYAKPRMSELWSVTYERNRASEIPAIVLGARNMQGFSIDKGFGRRVDGFRVRFRNADLDYAEDDITVLDPLRTSDEFLAEITYDALVTEAAVIARALYDLAVLRQRMAFYSCTVGWNSLVMQRGDLIGINNDVLSVDYGSARIKSVTRSGGRISAITLDGSVPGPASTGPIGISVQLRNGGGVWTRPATGVSGSAQEITAVTFSPTITDPGATALTEGCLAVIGKAGVESKRMLLFSALPKDDFTADLTLVDAAPALAQMI
jgi:hypothetical protein